MLIIIKNGSETSCTATDSITIKKDGDFAKLITTGIDFDLGETDISAEDITRILMRKEYEAIYIRKHGSTLFMHGHIYNGDDYISVHLFTTNSESKRLIRWIEK